jgi:hypothetical protein
VGNAFAVQAQTTGFAEEGEATNLSNRTKWIGALGLDESHAPLVDPKFAWSLPLRGLRQIRGSLWISQALRRPIPAGLEEKAGMGGKKQEATNFSNRTKVEQNQGLCPRVYAMLADTATICPFHLSAFCEIRGFLWLSLASWRPYFHTFSGV